MANTSVDLDSNGHSNSVVVSGNKTLAATDAGTIQDVQADATITLPSTAAALPFIIRVGAEGLTVNVSPAAADQIAGNGFTAADNKDLIFTDQPAGSYVALIGDGAAGWYVQRIRGTATREA